MFRHDLTGIFGSLVPFSDPEIKPRKISFHHIRRDPIQFILDIILQGLEHVRLYLPESLVNGTSCYPCLHIEAYDKRHSKPLHITDRRLTEIPQKIIIAYSPQ